MRFNLLGRTLTVICLLLTIGATNRALAVPPLPGGPPGYSPASSDSSTPEAESGTVDGGAYSNRYFDFAYPLLPDWREDFKGPLPSNTGYYVLSALRPKGELNGTVLVAAQDTFFTARPVNNSLDLLKQMEQRAILSTLKIEGPPREIKIAGHSFARLDYTGAGLHHAIFAMDIRCHVVTVEFTTRDAEVLQQLSDELKHVTLPPDAVAETGGGEFPVCVKDYARGANVLHQVDPLQVGPSFTSVPARIIIDKLGKVKHVHVINAFPEQARSVMDALAQWTFVPYIQNGQPQEVETGILFKFGGANKSGVTMVTSGSSEHRPAAKELP
ncbi:MAG TPA: energy transducer TonB [Candidatus Angelobacter sp.]|jgi:hypothetical protein